MDQVLQLYPWLTVAITAMLPIIEVRGAVPVAITVYHLHPLLAIIIAVLASMIPAILLLLFLERVTKWLQSIHPVFDHFFVWLFKRTYHRHSARFERWGSLALMLFVAVPLPFTGVWTGALLAYVFGIQFKHAAVFIAAGSLIAAIIVAAISLGGLFIFSL